MSRAPRTPNGPAAHRNERRRVFGLTLLALLAAIQWLACAGNPEPYTPRRPRMGPSGRAVAAAIQPETFPERELSTLGSTSPPQALALIDRIFRSVASTHGLEEEPVLAMLETEIDSIRAELRALGLGAGALMRRRLGEPRPEEKEAFARSAVLYTRWALARMRTGSIDERVRGTELLRDAKQFAPENPVLAVIRATYLDFAGFRSNAVRELDEFQEEFGPSDLVDLVRVRKRERAWKLLGAPEPLEEAGAILDSMALRSAGWEEAPTWLVLERARLAYYLEATPSMIERAQEVLARVEGRAADRSPEQSLAAEAYLLLGIAATRELEYGRADSCFDRALEHALLRPEDAELASILQVPWDLWTEDERFGFDRSFRRVNEVERFWRDHDPILATPGMQENQVEYCRRVAETWFQFSDLDLTRSGPFTDPGRAVLRFGWPRAWKRVGSQRLSNFTTTAALDFGVILTWEFEYLVRKEEEEFPRTITFQDPSGRAAFVATDSLRGRDWPPHWFNFDFDGRSYPTSSSITRFREFDGKTRLVLSFDTLLPNYSVRYPMQGYAFDGTAAIDLAVLQTRDSVTVTAWTGGVALDRETLVRHGREFRRRSGYLVRSGVERGVYQFASMLTLRDAGNRVVAVGVDNGKSETIAGFRRKELDASDLLLAGSVAGMVREDEERRVRDWVVYGPDPAKFDLVPRASRSFLQGDELAFYLEVYNIAEEDGFSIVDIRTTLETLRPDGEVLYAITLSGAGSTLTRGGGVDQWNVVRSIGLQNIKPGLYNLSIEVLDRKAKKKLYRDTYFEVVPPERLIEHYRWRELEPPRTANVVKETGTTTQG